MNIILFIGLSYIKKLMEKVKEEKEVIEVLL